MAAPDCFGQETPCRYPRWWALTFVAIVGLLEFDFVFHVRKALVPTLSEAAAWSAVYVGVALLFGVGVLVFGGAKAGPEYFAVRPCGCMHSPYCMLSGETYPGRSCQC